MGICGLRARRRKNALRVRIPLSPPVRHQRRALSSTRLWSPAFEDDVGRKRFPTASEARASRGMATSAGGCRGGSSASAEDVTIEAGSPAEPASALPQSRYAAFASLHPMWLDPSCLGREISVAGGIGWRRICARHPSLTPAMLGHPLKDA